MRASRGSEMFAGGLFFGLGNFLAHESRRFFGSCSFRFRRRLRMKLLGARLLAPFGGAGERFPRKHLDSGAVPRRNGGRGSMQRGSMRRVMFVGLIVLEVFKNVADVEKCVAIQPNVHESRLHAREDACNFSFVDTADESEFFFPLD